MQCGVTVDLQLQLQLQLSPATTVPAWTASPETGKNRVSVCLHREEPVSALP